MIKKLTAVFVNDSSGYLEHNKVMYVISGYLEHNKVMYVKSGYLVHNKVMYVIFMCIVYLTKKKVISAV